MVRANERGKVCNLLLALVLALGMAWPSGLALGATDEQQSANDAATESTTKSLTDAEVADVLPTLLEVVTNYSPGSSTNASTSEFAQALQAANGVGLADTDILSRYGAEPDFEVTYQGETLVEGVDYEVSYEETRNVGTATATLTGLGDFAGSSTTKTYQIVGYIAHGVDGSGSPQWPTGSTWTGTVLSTKFLVFLADGTYVSAFTTSIADLFALHCETFTGSSANTDREEGWIPADTVVLTAEDGSWEAEARYTFYTGTVSGSNTEYLLSNFYTFTQTWSTAIYRASGMAALAQECNLNTSYTATLVSENLAKAFGVESDLGASLVNFSIEPTAEVDSSYSWSSDGASVTGLGTVAVPDAGLSAALESAIDLGLFEDYPMQTTYQFSYGLKVLPYDLTSDSEDGTYSGIYANVTSDTLASLGNADYDGSSAGSIPHGATVIVNEGKPVVETGEALDVAGSMLSVIDAFGDDVMDSPDAVEGTDYTISYEMLDDDGEWATVSEVKDLGTYRVTITGACAKVTSTGLVTSKNRHFYAGSASAEFEVMSAIDAAIVMAEEALEDTPISADGKDLTDGSTYVTQDVHDALSAALATAKAVAANESATQDELDKAADALNAALETFETAKLTAEVDTTALETAIAAAEEAVDGALVSADGKDLVDGLIYVSQESCDTLSAAVATAKEALADEAATQNSIDEATATLQTAQATFEDAKVTAVVDLAALNGAIATAQELADSVVSSDDGSDVADGSDWATSENIATLNAAIATAQTAAADASATQNTADAATDTLNAAIEAFKAMIGVAKVDTAALSSAVSAAQELVGGVASSSDGSDVSDGARWATSEDIATFNAAIEAAQAVANDATATQNAVDAAVATLSEAAAAFEAAVNTAETTLAEAMFTVDTADELWAGEAVTKAVSGKDGETALVEGIDYEVSYEGNARPGTATVTVAGIGGYRGELTYEFFIYYADVPTSLAGDGDAWYYDAIYELSELGVMSGYDTNWHFGVGDPITRQDVVTMLWRYCCPEEYAAYDASAAANGSGLADVEDGMYYTAAVNWAVEAGIVTGYTEGDDAGTFGVGDTMTFEQLVTVIARMELGGRDAAAAYSTASLYSGDFADASQVSDWAAGAMAWAVDQGLVTGYVESAGTASLVPLSDVERERVATVLGRYIDLVS